MQRSQPFARAIMFMQALASAMSLPPIRQQVELANLGEYRSRGKGLGRHSGKKWGPRSSHCNMHQVKTQDGKLRWLQRENSPRECERRMRQMARDAANQARRLSALAA